MQSQNLFTYRYLLIPSNTDVQETGKGSHWFLMIYDTVENFMYTMDSVY
jgi:Ulp1 family protease